MYIYNIYNLYIHTYFPKIQYFKHMLDVVILKCSFKQHGSPSSAGECRWNGSTLLCGHPAKKRGLEANKKIRGCLLISKCEHMLIKLSLFFGSFADCADMIHLEIARFGRFE